MMLLLIVVAVFFLLFFLTAGFLMLADVIMRDVYKALGIFQKKTPFPVVLLAAALATAARASAQVGLYQEKDPECEADFTAFVEWVQQDREYAGLVQDYLQQMETPTNSAAVVFVAGTMIARYSTWAMAEPATPQRCARPVLTAIGEETYLALRRLYEGGR